MFILHSMQHDSDSHLVPSVAHSTQGCGVPGAPVSASTSQQIESDGLHSSAHPFANITAYLSSVFDGKDALRIKAVYLYYTVVHRHLQRRQHGPWLDPDVAHDVVLSLGSDYRIHHVHHQYDVCLDSPLCAECHVQSLPESSLLRCERCSLVWYCVSLHCCFDAESCN